MVTAALPALEQALARAVGEDWQPWVHAGPEQAAGLDHVAYHVVGPVLAAFAGWLADHRRTLGMPLFCVMREGGLLRRLIAATDPHAAPSVHELWLNRRLCLKAAVLSAWDEEGLLNFLVRARRAPLTVAQAVAEFALPPGPLPENRILAADSPALAAFLSWLQTDPVAAALNRETGRTRAALLAHLRQAGALDVPILALADLGYAANIQNAVEKILRHGGSPVTTAGFYLVTTPGAEWARRRGGQVTSFLAHLGQPEWFVRLFARSPEPLEALCASTIGPLVDWTDAGEPICAPALLSSAQQDMAERLQAMMVSLASQRIDWGDAAASARLRLARFLALPTHAEAAALAPWVYEETMLGATVPLAMADSDPWRHQRAVMPWPAAGARLAGWTDEALLGRVANSFFTKR